MKILIKFSFFLLLSCLSINSKLESLFIVREKNRTGLLDSKGAWIVKPKFQNIYTIHPWRNYVIVVLKGKYGVVSRKGEVLIKPKFTNLVPFNEKYIFASSSKNNNWGIINIEGDWIVQPKYSKIALSTFWGSEKLKVYSAFKDGYWGIYSLEGKRVLKKHSKKEIYCLSDERFLIFDDKTNLFGIINKEGDWISELFKKERIFLPRTKFFLGLKTNKGWGVMSINGKWLFKPQFDRITEDFFNSSRNLKIFWVKKEGFWSAINIFSKKIVVDKLTLNENELPFYLSKKFLVSRQFKIEKDQNNNIIGYTFSGDSGLKIYSLKGEEQFENYSITSIEKDYLFFRDKKTRKRGIIDSNGKVFFKSVNVIFLSYFYRKKNVFFVKLGGKIGCIDLKGNWLIRPTYDSMF